MVVTRTSQECQRALKGHDGLRVIARLLLFHTLRKRLERKAVLGFACSRVPASGVGFAGHVGERSGGSLA